VALVEVDGFDEISTAAEADESSRLVAEVLCDTLRPDDLICRIGTGGFVAVLEQCSGSNAAAAMERFRESLVLLLTQEDAAPFTCSAGVVESHRATSIDEIFEMATSACGEARAAGGNRVAVSGQPARQI
jgi:diguanylate cyclase (GGDEF)-like protein